MSKAPDTIWANTGLYWNYVQDWSEGSWGLDGTGVEYIRKDVSDARVAAAYDRGYSDVTTDDCLFSIPYNPPDDSRDALDALLKEAREKALREALQRIADLKRGHSEDVDEGHEQAYRAIEALIEKDETQ